MHHPEYFQASESLRGFSPCSGIPPIASTYGHLKGQQSTDTTAALHGNFNVSCRNHPVTGLQIHYKINKQGVNKSLFCSSGTLSHLAIVLFLAEMSPFSGRRQLTSYSVGVVRRAGESPCCLSPLLFMGIQNRIDLIGINSIRSR